MIFLYLFGFLPSIIWLLFYLRKDTHPESNSMILKVFFLGMVFAFLAIILEILFRKLNFKNLSYGFLLNIFIGGALIEEYVKYLTIKVSVFKNSELDEPVDLMLYMIISALGFAALENILKIVPFSHLEISDILGITIVRFISATFLHALCSGILGYFLALSFFDIKNRKKLLLIGFTGAVGLHGLYNLVIMRMEGFLKFYLVFLILIILAIFISLGFKKLKKMKSVCLM